VKLGLLDSIRPFDSRYGLIYNIGSIALRVRQRLPVRRGNQALRTFDAAILPNIPVPIDQFPLAFVSRNSNKSTFVETVLELGPPARLCGYPYLCLGLFQMKSPGCKAWKGWCGRS
jgi:hypothetical protein